MHFTNKLNRYLFKQLFVALSVVTVSLILVVWLSRSLRFVDYIVNRGVSLSLFGYLTSLLLPNLVYVVLPITLFAAILFTYNRISQDSELVVSYASGLSPLQVARPALVLAGCMTVFAYVLSLYLIPLSYRNFKDLQYEIRNDFSITLLEEGAFTQVTDDFTVYVRERTSEGELRGILVHDNREPDKPVTIIAEKGAIVSSSTGPRVVVGKGHRQQKNNTTGKVSLLYFDQYTIDLDQAKLTDSDRWREPRERYLGELLFPGQDENDRRHAEELIAKGHSHLIGPLYNISFALVALVLMLLGEYSRRGLGKRIALSVLVIIIWQATALGIENAAKKSNALIPLMYLAWLIPTSVFAYALFYSDAARDKVQRLLQMFSRLTSGTGT